MKAEFPANNAALSLLGSYAGAWDTSPAWALVEPAPSAPTPLPCTSVDNPW